MWVELGFCDLRPSGVAFLFNRDPTLSSPGATLSMRSLVKEEPDWRTGLMAGDRGGLVGGPLRLRRGSRFTWRKECQSIMERWVPPLPQGAIDFSTSEAVNVPSEHSE